ncbi:MAG: PorV/PorQ family protein [Candidatus Zixiibacteriota bacterium]
MKKLLVSILLPLFLSGSAYGASNNENVGTKVYPFLKNGIGARPLAMGGAFTGLADDESALYYNPAGVAGIRSKAFAASYVNYFGDVNAGYLGFLYPLGENQTAGAALNYFNYGEFVGLDSAGNSIGNFTPGDLAFQLSYARKFPKGFSLGVSGKIIYEKLQDYSSSALAFDLGALYHFPNERGRVGLAVQHLGFQISSFWDAPREHLPTVVKVGGSIYPVGLPMNVTLDVGFPTDNDLFISAGLEYLKLTPVFVRAGYSSFGQNYKAGLESGKDNLAGFSGGVGVIVQKFHVDYAFLPYSTLGSAHRFSGAYRF